MKQTEMEKKYLELEITVKRTEKQRKKEGLNCILKILNFQKFGHANNFSAWCKL